MKKKLEIETQLLRFMEKTPVWEFFNVSREVYCSSSKDEKAARIKNYYQQMLQKCKKYFFYLVCHVLTSVLCLNQASWSKKFSFLASFLMFFVLEHAPLMTDSVTAIEKANMLILTKETNEKDRNLKSKLLIATKNDEKSQSEKVFLEDGFFKNIKSDFNIFKVDSPENTLFYIDQGQLSIHKGKPIIYNDYVILGQIIPLQNPPNNLIMFAKKMKRKCLFRCMIQQMVNLKELKKY